MNISPAACWKCSFYKYTRCSFMSTVRLPDPAVTFNVKKNNNKKKNTAKM